METMNSDLSHEYICNNSECSEYNFPTLLEFSPNEMRTLSGQPATCNECLKTLNYKGSIP